MKYAFVILLACLFTLWRFITPGHPVSREGSIEVFAHFYAAIVLWEAGKGTWRAWQDAKAYGTHCTADFVLNTPWVLHACWFIPSMVELALFLLGPFNPF